MTPETLTLISGVVLLLVLALAGWRVHRRPSVHDGDADETELQ